MLQEVEKIIQIILKMFENSRPSVRARTTFYKKDCSQFRDKHHVDYSLLLKFRTYHISTLNRSSSLNA